MAQDPAFLFYPGDYLRDTHCLSEKSQVAYDRIMCEHMRNICEDMSKIAISQERLNFFTKNLNDAERAEIFSVLKKNASGYQIEWVAESVSKRKAYTNSRSKNRSSKRKNISNSYDVHMEIENEIENVNKELGKGVQGENQDLPWNTNPVHSNVAIDLPPANVDAIITRLHISKNIEVTEDQVRQLFEVFKVDNLNGQYYGDKREVFKHFSNWITYQNFKNGTAKQVNARKSVVTGRAASAGGF